VPVLEVGKRSRRRMRCARAAWRTRDHLAEVARLHALYRHDDCPSVRDELLAAASEALRAWARVRRADELGDRWGVSDAEHAWLARRVEIAAKLINVLAPEPPERSDDWARIAATPAVGAKAARTKIMRVTGKHLAGRGDPALARDHAHRINAECIPPLAPARVDELVDLVIQREAAK
jgi:hypothetical protein